MDFSIQAALIVEAVRNAMYDITEAAQGMRADAASVKPTPFQRAIVGGLVLIAAGEYFGFSSQELDAAKRAIVPYLDERP